MSNYRDNYSDRHQDDGRNDDPAARWRRGEDRYRREAYGAQGDGGSDDARYDRGRSPGYGPSYGRGSRDDDYGARSGYGNASSYDWRERGQGQRGSSEGRHYDREQPQHHEHREDHGQPFTGGYRDNGDTSWFTGNQGSWAVGDPRVQDQRPGTSGYGSNYGYGGGQYGGASDYRSHGYARKDGDGHRGFWDRASDEVASWFGDEDAARRRDQDHRGRGPQGYTRSDERIREDANDRLTDDWRVDASNVDVTVNDGEVTLNGTVTSREAKRRAEDVVDGISGVKHVQNNLRVQQQGASGGSGGSASSGSTGNWGASATSSTAGGLATSSSAGSNETKPKV